MSATQVSVYGGNDPVWAHSGRELFYRNATNEMVAVEITEDPSFAVGQQTMLFSMADYLPSNGHPVYDVSPDDQRSVMLRVGGLGTSDAQLILVENFFEELKPLVGN